MPALSPALPVGTPVWADLASSDLEASTAFYGAVLGWTRRDFPEFDDYADFQSNGKEVGGLAPKVDEVNDAWTVYLKVDDIQTAVIAAAEAGAPCWFELHTKDFAAAVPFYEKVFGWKVTSIGDSDEFRMVVFGEQGAAVAGILDAARIPADETSRWIVYLAVADADAAASRVTASGGTVFDGPTDTPFGRMSRAADSTGARFCLIQLPAQESADEERN